MAATPTTTQMSPIQAALLDLSLTRSVTRRVAAFATVENLFDTEYDTGRTPTRTIGVPLTMRGGVRLFLR